MAASQDTTLYNIKKLDGTNFSLWKKQIWHVLVQKKQIKPIKLKGIKPEDMDEDEWSEMDELALSTIMLTLAESVGLWRMDKAKWPLWEAECSFTGLLAQKACWFEDERRDTYVQSS